MPGLRAALRKRKENPTGREGHGAKTQKRDSEPRRKKLLVRQKSTLELRDKIQEFNRWGGSQKQSKKKRRGKKEMDRKPMKSEGWAPVRIGHQPVILNTWGRRRKGSRGRIARKENRLDERKGVAASNTASKGGGDGNGQ